MAANNPEISIDNTSRCPQCNLISSLSCYYKDGKSYINYYCENNHKGTMPLEEYMQKFNNYSLSKEKCSECNRNQSEANGAFSFCTKCNKFLCYSCIINHPNNAQHNITSINRYDALCKLHANYYGFYCIKCDKNLCLLCKNDHNSHDIIDLLNFKNSYESSQNIEEKIKQIEKKINYLEQIKNNIINEIDIIKKSSELEIKYFNMLLNTFKYEENHNNINYNVIHNIKNFDEIFQKYKVKLLDKINNESNKFISSLKTFGLLARYKNINDPSGIFAIINHLSILKDGRLASCLNSNLVNIYKKDTFELQLSIKEHSGSV